MQKSARETDRSLFSMYFEEIGARTIICSVCGNVIVDDWKCARIEDRSEPRLPSQGVTYYAHAYPCAAMRWCKVMERQDGRRSQTTLG